MSNNSTMKRPANSGIHLDEWIDLDNQVHKFYEPIYPGPLANKTFTSTSRDEAPPDESQNPGSPDDILPL